MKVGSVGVIAGNLKKKKVEVYKFDQKSESEFTNKEVECNSMLYPIKL